MRLALSVIIMLLSVKMIENFFNLSWLVALLISAIYLVIIMLITKKIDSTVKTQ